MMTVGAQGLDHLKAEQRAGHIITGSSDCLSPGRAIEKPARLNQDVES